MVISSLYKLFAFLMIVILPTVAELCELSAIPCKKILQTKRMISEKIAINPIKNMLLYVSGL